MGCGASSARTSTKRVTPATSSPTAQEAVSDGRPISVLDKDRVGTPGGLQLSSAVKVVVVVRPLLDFEKQKGGGTCIEAPNATTVALPGRRGEAEGFTFEYDRVYKMINPGRQLFAEVVEPLLQRLLQGFNTTIFAYGQTGSGKTYCMGTGATTRTVAGGGEADGVIPRSVKYIFAALAKIREHYDVSIKVAFVEIYNDDIRDLLGDSDAPSAIAVRESPERGTFQENVQEVEVRSDAEVMRLLEAGNVHRAVAAHNLNDASSRSHAICTLQMEQRRRPGAPAAAAQERFLRSKLHLVDLAGSERAKETGTTGQQFAEGVGINKGLSALGNVIGALSEGAARKHIPYRDSKLTRLLQDSLGGNAETLMVACVSPASQNFEPSLSTLRYAQRARSIRNRVSRNSKYTLEDELAYLRTQLEERTALVAKLQSQLDTAVRMLKSAKIVLPPQLTSPAGTPNLASARLSYAGGGVL